MSSANILFQLRRSFNPMDSLARVAKLRSMQNDNALEQQNIQLNQAKLDEIARQNQERANLESAASAAMIPAQSATGEIPGMEVGGVQIPGRTSSVTTPAQFDRAKFLSRLSPLQAMGAQSQFATQDAQAQKYALDLKKKAQEIDDNTLKMLVEKTKLGHQLAGGIASLPDELQGLAYQQKLPILRQFDPSLPDQYPGKAWALNEAKQTLDANQIFQQEVSARDFKLKQSQFDETKRHNVAMENKPSAGDGAANQEVEQAARSLALDPYNLTTLKDIASLRGTQRLQIFNRAKQLNPNFDQGIIENRQKFVQQYEDPKGRAAINRQAINNILQHAGDLREINDKYRYRSEFRPLNTPVNAIARNFGSQAYTDFATTLGVLKDELALYFAGGYAPQSNQMAMWDKIAKDEATPAQIEEFAREVAKLGLRRATTFNSQFRKNMGYDDPNMIIPEAAAAAEKLGLGGEVKKFGSGGTYGNIRNPQQSQDNGGFTIKLSSGKTVTIGQ